MNGAADEEELERARQAAETALREHVRVDAWRLVPETGGLTNLVFSADTDKGPLVVRLGPADKRDSFERERQVIDHVRGAGVPAPEVLTTGENGGFAYMIGRRLPGEMAAHHPERLRTLRDLGALAAERIHVIRTGGFGPAFQFGAAEKGPGWRSWLMAGLEAPRRIELLREHGVIDARREAELLQTLETVAGSAAEPVLNHGDLRLKNVVVDEEGAIIGLLDWDQSISAAGPDWDLSVALHDLWADQMQAFLEGYGLDHAAIQAAAPAWRLFNALNYAPEIERAIEERDERTVRWLRLRFSGALNLF